MESHCSWCTRVSTDKTKAFEYDLRVSSDRSELKEARAAYFARWEAVAAAQAKELAAMTDERAWEIMQNLGAVEPWRERPDWSGLVEQQAIFHQNGKS